MSDKVKELGDLLAEAASWYEDLETRRYGSEWSGVLVDDFEKAVRAATLAEVAAHLEELAWEAEETFAAPALRAAVESVRGLGERP